MIPHKNNNGKHSGLSDRLAACIDRVGSKRAMCSATLISEAQLFRYINGETDIPSEKLIAIAKAADVDAGWLLTGDGATETVSTELRPSFRPELMVQIVQVFEELLVEFEKSFNPRQRARAMTFLYNAIRHEEMVRDTTFQPQKFDMLKYLNFLGELRTEEELEILNSAIEVMEYVDNPQLIHDEAELLKTWCNLLVRGMKGYYSSYAGQVYFERRSGGDLEPAAILKLQNTVMQSCQLIGKTNLEWLDVGCGNGRHLQHIYKHMPNITVRGIELSQLGYNICKELMIAEKLPQDSVVMGDMRHMPYSSQSFDAIFAHMSLHCLPYIRGSGLGLEEAMSEIGRVLKANGIATVIFPAGNWRDYSMPRQFMNEVMIRELAQTQGFEVVSCILQDEKTSGGYTVQSRLPNPITFAYSETYWAVFRKK